MGGLRVGAEAAATVLGWARLTGKSANWIVNWSVNTLQVALVKPESARAAREELEGIARLHALKEKNERAERAQAEKIRSVARVRREM